MRPSQVVEHRGRCVTGIDRKLIAANSGHALVIFLECVALAGRSQAVGTQVPRLLKVSRRERELLLLEQGEASRKPRVRVIVVHLQMLAVMLDGVRRVALPVRLLPVLQLGRLGRRQHPRHQSRGSTKEPRQQENRQGGADDG